MPAKRGGRGGNFDNTSGKETSSPQNKIGTRSTKKKALENQVSRSDNAHVQPGNTVEKSSLAEESSNSGQKITTIEKSSDHEEILNTQATTHTIEKVTTFDDIVIEQETLSTIAKSSSREDIPNATGTGKDTSVVGKSSCRVENASAKNDASPVGESSSLEKNPSAGNETSSVRKQMKRRHVTDSTGVTTTSASSTKRARRNSNSDASPITTPLTKELNQDYRLLDNDEKYDEGDVTGEEIKHMWDQLPSDTIEAPTIETVQTVRTEINEEHFSVASVVIPWIAAVLFVYETTSSVFVSPRVNHRMMDRVFANQVLVDSIKNARNADWSEEVTICFWMNKKFEGNEYPEEWEPLYSSYKLKGDYTQTKIKHSYAAPVTYGAFRNLVKLLQLDESFADIRTEPHDEAPIVEAAYFQRLLESPILQRMAYPIKDIFAGLPELEQTDILRQPLTINLVTKSIRMSAASLHKHSPIFIGILDGQHRGLVANCLAKGYKIPESGEQNISKDFHFRSLGSDSALNSKVKVSIAVPRSGKLDAELFRQESNRLNIRKHEGLSDTYRSKMFALLTDTGSKSMKQLKTRFWQVGYATTPNVSLVEKKTYCEYIPSILCLKLYFYFVHWTGL